MTREGIPAPSGDEMAALRVDSAWAETVADRLDLLGEDRVRFLHNLITCDVRELEPGATARGFLAHGKGGVLAVVDVLAHDDRLRLVLPTGRSEAVRGHLEKYRVAERVEIEERVDLVAIALRGARAPEALAALGLPVPDAGQHRTGELAGASLGVRREVRGREPRYELEHASADRDDVVAALSGAPERVGLVAVSAAAIECARVEDGEFAWGVDYGEENFPQETGELTAVSFTKGCYLGQEVVARIHYRGGVQRVPRGLRFAGEPPAPRTELFHDGRPSGRVTSVARSPRFGPIGLALVQRRAEPGAEVVVAGGGTATLVELPFGGPDLGGASR